MRRRTFITETSKAAVGFAILGQLPISVSARTTDTRRKLAIVGTGHRASGMWGKTVVESYGDLVEFVGLCDVNPGRLEVSKRYIGATCPTFKNYEEMLTRTKPDAVIVATVDSTHHTLIAEALAMGCDVITEKPLTTDEVGLKVILDAQKHSKNNIIVTHNLRYTPTTAKIKELLLQERIGRVTSVDLHWYLDVYHGADYFRRWHRLREYSGSLLVHKASHHFDLLNWWINSDPVAVNAFGALEFYGKNHEFRHTHCRPCPFKEKCTFYWDMTKDKRMMYLYAANEKYDGYLRDGCVWREDIDIFDKMAVQIQYANKVQVSYSLTTYSPYEGYRVAFNGTRGRLDFWMQEKQPWPMDNYDEIQVTDNFGKAEYIKLPHGDADDHLGGDSSMKEKIFRNPSAPDPLKQTANVRDGAMAVLIGVAARKSIDSGKVVMLSDVTDFATSNTGER